MLNQIYHDLKEREKIVCCRTDNMLARTNASVDNFMSIMESSSAHTVINLWGRQRSHNSCLFHCKCGQSLIFLVGDVNGYIDNHYLHCCAFLYKIGISAFQKVPYYFKKSTKLPIWHVRVRTTACCTYIYLNINSLFVPRS